MFTVIGCLGSVVAEVNTVPDAIASVLSQIPVSDKKVRSMTNALERLATGAEYHIEYGGSGCTVRKV